MILTLEKMNCILIFFIVSVLFSGSAERQARLRDLGVQKSLHQLSTTTTGDLQQRLVLNQYMCMTAFSCLGCLISIERLSWVSIYSLSFSNRELKTLFDLVSYIYLSYGQKIKS